MISLVICSIDAAKFAAVHAMYQKALAGESWEMIHIPDAKSLAEGYNRGIARSRGEIVIFSHDDVEVLSPDLPRRLHAHLANFDLVGVAGTNRLINGQWNSAGPPYIFGQVAHLHAEGGILVQIYGAPQPVVGNMQTLDGLFIAARRAVLEKIAFDAVTFDGFHLYDSDFSYQAYRAGFRLAVANDINLLHLSNGQYNDVWLRYVDRFQSKWFNPADLRSAPPFQWWAVMVDSRAQALEVMTPPYWQDS